MIIYWSPSCVPLVNGAGSFQSEVEMKQILRQIAIPTDRGLRREGRSKFFSQWKVFSSKGLVWPTGENGNQPQSSDQKPSFPKVQRGLDLGIWYGFISSF